LYIARLANAYKGYAPLISDFDNFFTRRLYARIRDVFNRPITGVPGRTITLLDRVPMDRHNSQYKLTGTQTECINFGSYNYLGFAQSQGPCADAAQESIEVYGCGVGMPRLEGGTLDKALKLEKIVAEFVGQEDAVTFNMGFATNSTTIPALVGKGCLILSDELNHSSIVFGSRLSGASIRVYKHNDMKDLESVLRDAISQGQARTHRPWKKILLIVEGLYSMEGSIVKLPEILRLKKEYKFYLYVDEAHSIGALGPRGRGVCDYWGVDPREVDILMGTFTKSFGAAGGYLAGSKHIIDWVRLNSHSTVYAEPMPAPVIQQIITSMNIIMGRDGTDEGQKRLQKIKSNAAYISKEFKKLGLIVYGDVGSPIIPVLVFNPAKIPSVSRKFLERGVAVVGVGYPATPIISSRVRICVSAAHTQADLDYLVDCMKDIAKELVLDVSNRKHLIQQ
jgi:7-keto-8-aminopelargonate synthetase-like enzyme